MKRSITRILAAAGITFAVFSFSSCSFLWGLFEDVLLGDDETTTATVDESWTYQKKNPVFEVSSDVRSVTITGLSKGQEIYISKTNPDPSSGLLGYSEIPSSHTQYVGATSNITNYTSATTSISAARTAEELEADLSSLNNGNKHYRAPTILPKDLPNSVPTGARAVDTNPDYKYPVDQTTTNIDSTVKYVYIDADSALSTYKLAKSVLRAVGDYCYVWVVDGYFESDNAYGYYYEPRTNSDGENTTPRKTSTKYEVSTKSNDEDKTGNERVTREFVENVADNFDQMYPLIHNVYGKESDKLYDNSSEGWIDMRYLSDTGTKVNIVIYDIGADHAQGNSTGVLGYFYSKDYFQNSSHYDYDSATPAMYSNEGKYFYIDSYFSRTDPLEIYSTLGHEFQHMVNFAQKSVNKALYPSTQFNEMLSMLCEDIILAKLGLTPDKGPYNRLPYFNGSYLYSGIEYREGLELLGYATNYAFGAWLIREFGGVPLITEMMTANAVDNDAIVYAVNKLNGTEYKFEDLLCLYTQACIYKTSPLYYTAPTLNQGSTYPKQTGYEYPDGITYSYPIRAINLWDLNTLMGTSESNYYYPSTDGGNLPYAFCKYDGPMLYSAKEQGALRPFGMMLTKVGKVNTSGTSTVIDFGNTSQVSIHEKLYIIVK